MLQICYSRHLEVSGKLACLDDTNENNDADNYNINNNKKSRDYKRLLFLS